MTSLKLITRPVPIEEEYSWRVFCWIGCDDATCGFCTLCMLLRNERQAIKAAVFGRIYSSVKPQKLLYVPTVEELWKEYLESCGGRKGVEFGHAFSASRHGPEAEYRALLFDVVCDDFRLEVNADYPHRNNPRRNQSWITEIESTCSEPFTPALGKWT